MFTGFLFPPTEFIQHTQVIVDRSEARAKIDLSGGQGKRAYSSGTG